VAIVGKIFSERLVTTLLFMSATLTQRSHFLENQGMSGNSVLTGIVWDFCFC